MGVRLTMNQPSSRQLNEAYLDSESELRQLKKTNQSIETAYSTFQHMQTKEKELWGKLHQLSRGTEAERSITRECDQLEEEQQFFNRTLGSGEEALEQLIRKKTAQRNQLEEDFLKARKAENECQESTTKN